MMTETEDDRKEGRVSILNGAFPPPPRRGENQEAGATNVAAILREIRSILVASALLGEGVPFR